MDQQAKWGSNTLVTAFICGNDFLDAARAVAANPGDTSAILGAAVQNMFNSITSNISAPAAA